MNRSGESFLKSCSTSGCNSHISDLLRSLMSQYVINRELIIYGSPDKSIVENVIEKSIPSPDAESCA